MLWLTAPAVSLAAQDRDTPPRASTMAYLGISRFDFDRYIRGERDALVFGGVLRYSTNQVVSPQVVATFFQPDGIDALLLNVGVTVQNPGATVQPYVGAAGGYGARMAGAFESGVSIAAMGGVRYRVSARSRVVMELRATSVKRISNQALQLTAGYEWLRF